MRFAFFASATCFLIEADDAPLRFTFLNAFFALAAASCFALLILADSGSFLLAGFALALDEEEGGAVFLAELAHEALAASITS